MSVRSENSRTAFLILLLFFAYYHFLHAGFSVLPPKLGNPPRHTRKQHRPDQRRRNQDNRLWTILPTQLASRHHQRPDRLALLDGPGNHDVSRKHVRQQGGRVVIGNHRHRVGGRKVSFRIHASFSSHVSGRQKSTTNPIQACQLEHQLQRLRQRVSNQRRTPRLVTCLTPTIFSDAW